MGAAPRPAAPKNPGLPAVSGAPPGPVKARVLGHTIAPPACLVLQARLPGGPGPPTRPSPPERDICLAPEGAGRRGTSARESHPDGSAARAGRPIGVGRRAGALRPASRVLFGRLPGLSDTGLNGVIRASRTACRSRARPSRPSAAARPAVRCAAGASGPAASGPPGRRGSSLFLPSDEVNPPQGSGAA